MAQAIVRSANMIGHVMPDRPTLEQVQARSERNRQSWRTVDRQVAKPARKRSQRDPDAIVGKKTGRSTPPRSTEHQIQAAVIQWWDIWSKSKGLDYRLLHSIPNSGAGGSKGQAGKMKAEGCRRGYPDLALDLPIMSGERVVFHGARFELKAWKGRTSPEQRSYHALLVQHNLNVVVCYDYAAAVHAIATYCERALR